MTDDLIARLHDVAREAAAQLEDPDRKQLRFNEIVNCAMVFYRADPMGGVVELVQACDRSHVDLYVRGGPMHRVLMDEYGWMT